MTHILLTILGVLGLIISFCSKRTLLYRVKLGCLYLFLLLSIFVGTNFLDCYGHDDIHLFRNEENWSQQKLEACEVGHNGMEIAIIFFLFSLSVLHWRESKVDHEKIEESYLFLKSVIEVVPDMICIKDKDGRFVYTNKALRKKIFNMETDELILGKTVHELMEEWGLLGAPEYSLIDSCARSDEIVKETKVHKRFLEDGLVAGKYMAMQVQKAPIFNINGEFDGIVSIGRDMTYDINDHEEIHKLLIVKSYAKALELFVAHKNKYRIDMEDKTTNLIEIGQSACNIKKELC